jgi:hypothetical protein
MAAAGAADVALVAAAGIRIFFKQAFLKFVHGNFVVIPINIIYWYLSVILSKG